MRGETMYRILLADDERIMLEALKKTIEGAFGGACEIAMAKSGRMAIELAETFRPDIALMDIQMPGLNGIQAIKEIKKTNKDMIFIIITAYDQFDYAKQAIRLGVMEFLTKPVNRMTLIEVLTKAFKKLDEKREQRSYSLEVQEKLEKVLPVLENGYIHELLLSEDGSELERKYRTLLTIGESFAYVIVLEFGDYGENGRLTNEVGARVQAEEFYSRLRVIVKGALGCLVGPVMGNRIVLVVPCKTGEMTLEEKIRIIKKAGELLERLEEKISMSFRAGIGCVRELECIKKSFDEAMRALRKSNRSVVHIKDIPGAWTPPARPGAQEEKISVGESQKEVLILRAKSYIEENYQREISLEEVSKIVDISPYYFSTIFKQIVGKNFIEYLTDIRMRHAKNLLKDRSRSIKEICSLSGYSDPNYFSRLFKKYEGITPTEYRERI